MKEQIGRLERPLADALFVLLLIALVIGGGWLATRQDRYWDWTATRTNSLTPESRRILERLDGPLRVTVFAPSNTPLGKSIGRLLARYAEALPGMEIAFLDPQLFPEKARQAEVTLVGQILLEYRGRRETLNEISERAISAAIARLGTTRRPWVAVIEGHGERAIQGQTAIDLGRLGQALKEQGFLVRPLDLTTIDEVPVETHLILLSTPQIPLFPGEAERLTRYLDRGGNLLWLLDPGPLDGLEGLVESLGLKRLPGVVVDAAVAEFSVETPAVALIADFPDHPLFVGLTAPALLPGSLAFETQIAPGWTLDTYLATGDRSWNETGRIEGAIDRDEVIGEQMGPLPVLLALTRPIPGTDREQRVVVVGDGDFLSNEQLGAYGNQALAIRLFSWLSGSGSLPELPPLPVPAPALELDSRQRLLLGVGALGVLPGLFLATGLMVRWLRWRKR